MPNAVFASKTMIWNHAGKHGMENKLAKEIGKIAHIQMTKQSRAIFFICSAMDTLDICEHSDSRHKYLKGCA
jgi:hypothetical protein